MIYHVFSAISGHGFSFEPRRLPNTFIFISKNANINLIQWSMIDDRWQRPAALHLIALQQMRRNQQKQLLSPRW